jgi:hypothetical protein
MKTLSECFYFKKLEEDSPIAFKSLKEKLKYFHPGFHSTTPEGLNSRLTFMLQCVRPGDTIPVRGVADDLDVNDTKTARNTSFGPPPVCVLRIGDFYHSKIIIRSVDISYDEGLWDLNPEGIGVQPMIATVNCQISFIGGQGLNKPVERLQNALSSNFFGNTEIYDERSIPTSNTDFLKKEFMDKSFLEKLNGLDGSNKLTGDTQNTNTITQGRYIGVGLSPIDYTQIVNNIFDNTSEYFKQYETKYNVFLTKYGKDVTKLLMSPDYRSINDYDIYNTTSTTPGKTIKLFGHYVQFLKK